MKKIYLVAFLMASLSLFYIEKFNIGIGIVLVLVSLITFGVFKTKSLDKIIDMGYASGKKSFLVVKIFFLVGMISSIWINSGTIPGIVYYGIKFIEPAHFFILTFLIVSAVAFLLGSSFGTVGTVGIALMAVGKGIGVDPNITGGAILSGAYFGDRTSPVSSSANLVAVLTETELYTNIKNMLKTTAIPYAVTSLFYVMIADKNISSVGENPLSGMILENFTLNWIIFIPVLVILISAILKISVKLSMGISIGAASVIGFFLQGYTLFELAESLVMGFVLKGDTPLKLIIKGGGIISMWKACLIIFLSCFMAGIVQELKLLNGFDALLLKAKTRAQLFMATLVTSVITSAAGCNQAIAVVLTAEIMKPIYETKKVSKDEFAVDIENSSIVIPALIPWNIAGLIPAGMLGLHSLGYLKYSFYMVILPLWILIAYQLKREKI